MSEKLSLQSGAGGEFVSPYWVEPRVVQEVPANTVFERPLDSGLFVNEVRTAEEIAALDAAYRALDEPAEAAEL